MCVCVMGGVCEGCSVVWFGPVWVWSSVVRSCVLWCGVACVNGLACGLV